MLRPALGLSDIVRRSVQSSGRSSVGQGIGGGAAGPTDLQAAADAALNDAEAIVRARETNMNISNIDAVINGLGNQAQLQGHRTSVGSSGGSVTAG